MEDHGSTSLCECNICYEYLPGDDFVHLPCCAEKRICRRCVDCLTIPLCPYCRRPLAMLSHLRMATSYTPFNQFLYNQQAQFMAEMGMVDEIDCRLLDSRILRRRIRRLRKLQMRQIRP